MHLSVKKNIKGRPRERGGDQDKELEAELDGSSRLVGVSLKDIVDDIMVSVTKQ